MHRALLLSLALLAAPTAAQPADRSPPEAQRLPVHVGGRVARTSGGADDFGWPGVYFEGRFRGPEVVLAVTAASDHLAVQIDGKSRAVLQKPGDVRLLFSNLGGGEHLIRLQKLTESQTGGARFGGFFAGPETTPLPAAPRERQIEFIGDSYTVGYGDTGTSRTCSREQVHDTTDTSLAFGPRLAAELGADYRVNAFSGYGVVRNYGGGGPGESMLSRYARLIPGDPTRIDRGSPGWRPQLIVIGLGTNDFSTPLHPGEAWRDQAELRADYRAQYLAFARDLLQRHPQARLLLMAGPNFVAEVRAVAAALDSSGLRVRVVPYAGLELTGCDWHPSLRDHQRLAEALSEALHGFGEVWRPERHADSP